MKIHLTENDRIWLAAVKDDEIREILIEVDTFKKKRRIKKKEQK